jgi:hypothetical protein
VFSDDRMAGLSWFQQSLIGAQPIQQAIGFSGYGFDVQGLQGSYAGVQRGYSQLDMQQRASAIEAMETTGAASMLSISGSQTISRNQTMSDGTAAGALSANRQSQRELGDGGDLKLRKQLKEEELQLTRQIVQEQTRGAQVAIQGLEREKAALQEQLDLRKQQVGATGAAFGFQSEEYRNMTVNAARKLYANQGGSLSDEEVSALYSVARGVGGTLPDRLAGEGNRRGRSQFDVLKGLAGTQAELTGLEGKSVDVSGEITAKQELIVKLSADQEALEKELKPAIVKLQAEFYDGIRKVIQDEFRDQRVKMAHEAQGAAAGNSRPGLKK